jgi:hypothetical protein
MVGILMDTMGDADPSNDVVKNVWVLTYARPTVTQRIVAGLPFVYVRAGSRTAVAQSEFLDPIGMPVRAPSRADSSNTTDFRNEHLWQASNVLSAAQDLSIAYDKDRDARLGFMIFQWRP